MINDFLEYLDDMGAETEDTIERLGGNKTEYLEYLKKFTQDTNIVKLRQAVSQKDADAAMSAVHTLKGIALNLGLLPIADACMDMLLDFRAGNTSKAFSEMNYLNQTFDEWTKIIKSIDTQQ